MISQLFFAGCRSWQMIIFMEFSCGEPLSSVLSWRPTSRCRKLGSDCIAHTTAMPIAEPLTRPISQDFVPRKTAMKRDLQLDTHSKDEEHDPIADYPPSPAKRRSPPSDSLATKPLRSSLARKPPAPGSMAAFTASASSSTSSYQSMYLSYVMNALAEKENGNEAPYLELSLQFAEPRNGAKSTTSISSLRSLLAALSHVVSNLDRSHSKLVENIFALPWTSMDDSFAQLWIKFVCSLVSARSEWLLYILTKATKALSYRLEWLPYQFADDDTTRSISTFKRKQVYERVHVLLRSLLSVIPTLPSVLGPLLVQFLPHKGVHRSDQLVYVRNILHISQYCAELSETILGAVIDRAIQLDVEIQVELDEFDDHEAEELGLEFDDPFEQALDAHDGATSDDESDDEGDFADNLSDLSDQDYGQDEQPAHVPTQDDLERSMRHIKDSVAKLDAIMMALFEHLRTLDSQYVAGPKAVSFPSASLQDSLSNRRNLFHTILGIFARNILPTFRSRHVQFLLFWFNSTDPEFSDFFLGLLLEKSLYSRKQESSDAEEPAVIRSAAAGYVASFVSRASYVDSATTRIVMYNLCMYLDAHIDEASRPDTEAGMAPAGSGTHAVFYSVAQAAFYIFCFRWRDLKLARDEQEASVDRGSFADGVSTSSGADDMADASGLHTSIGSLSHFTSEAWCDGLATVQRAITSRLNPLRFCSATVVKQFARIAQHTGFLYCYSIIDANNRSNRRSTMGVPAAVTRTGAPVSRSTSLNRIHLREDGASTPMSQDGSDRGTPKPEIPPTSTTNVKVTTASVLEAFFPFDPYKLESSAAFINPFYREWADVAPDEDDDDEDEEDEEDDGDHDEEEGEDDDARRNKALAIPGTRLASSITDTDDTTNDDEGNTSSFVSQVEAMSISPYHGS